ncbi:MAG TPA: hypothetical protein PKE58_17865, partial [Acidobacteriota bacterium]|nr:hypothetical protein [Acidobacteriota bacterium]
RFGWLELFPLEYSWKSNKAEGFPLLQCNQVQHVTEIEHFVTARLHLTRSFCAVFEKNEVIKVKIRQ